MIWDELNDGMTQHIDFQPFIPGASSDTACSMCQAGYFSSAEGALISAPSLNVGLTSLVCAGSPSSSTCRTCGVGTYWTGLGLWKINYCLIIIVWLAWMVPSRYNHCLVRREHMHRVCARIILVLWRYHSFKCHMDDHQTMTFLFFQTFHCK